jgi:phosphotransferase system enzyme I (PtsP)
LWVNGLRRSEKDILGLLCDIGELSARLAGSSDLKSILNQIVEMVANHLHSDVCSIYLYDDVAETLTLRATVGLNPDRVGSVQIEIREGLIGRSLRELRPICVENASSHPDYKRIDGLNEERFESFLAVPILKGVEKIGVLVVQREHRGAFGEKDVMALRATASQLASAIETARILMELQGQDASRPARGHPDRQVKLVKAEVASKGFAYATVLIHDPTRSRRSLSTRSFGRQYSVEELRAALTATSEQLQSLQKRVGRRLPEMASLIFDAHLMMLKDHAFVGEMLSRAESGENPPLAVQHVSRKYADLLIASNHAYIREKAQDVEDLSQRILANLTGTETGVDVAVTDREHVIVARELYPSDVLKLVTSNVKGVVLVSGGVTSHVSILARSLELPLVIAQDQRLLDLDPKSKILLDAELGNIHVNPDEEIVETFRDRNQARRAVGKFTASSKPETYTRDGHRVRLLANVNLLTDLALVRQVQAEGVGLYRSEFPFLIRTALPSEEEQYVIYNRLLDELDGHELTFRTLDVGGDKLLSYFDESVEENPALGLRAIRFSMRHMDVFRQQIRALLRAGAGGDRLRIMFPMIAGIEDFLQARRVVDQCIEELSSEKLAHCDDAQVGVMVEVPSAVATVDVLAKEADFLCVGTNDLTQFLLAVDRTNEKVASYFRSHHPAMLRALARVAKAGREAGREVSVCGEMAHETRFAAFLVGIGVGAFSVDPRYLPELQRRIEELDMPSAQRRAKELLDCTTLAQVEQALGQAGVQSSPSADG